MIGPVLTSRIRNLREWLKVDRFGHTTLGFDPNEPIRSHQFVISLSTWSRAAPCLHRQLKACRPSSYAVFDNMGITFLRILERPAY